MIVEALKNKYSLPLLLTKLHFSRSSYYYQKSCHVRVDKYIDIRNQVISIFYENKERYGCRRIHAMLQRYGITISEKVVRRLMQQEHLLVKVKKRRGYNSYKYHLGI